MRIPPRSLALFSLLSAFAQAAVVNVDFNFLDPLGTPSPSFSGLAAAPDPAGVSALWNSAAPWIDRVDAVDLLDSTGAATSVSVSLSVSKSFASVAGEHELGAGGAFVALMSDYAILDSGSPLLVQTESGSISGLVPTHSYDLYFYGQGDNFTRSGPKGQNTLFTVGGEGKQTGWDGYIGGDGLLMEGIEYVKFTVEADAEGKIVFSWANVVPTLEASEGIEAVEGNVTSDQDGQASRFAAFNALQIVENSPGTVPEPSVALLGGLGLLALLRRRRA
jgi:MYXO-CTERM domain-containing protein